MISFLQCSRWRNWCFACNRFNVSLGAIYRREELQGLIIWATQKNISGPLRLYKQRYQDEELRIARYKLRSPKLMEIARIAVFINKIVSSNPQYKAKGAAARYRYKLA